MTKIQSIVFSKKLWTLKECRKWLRQHKFKSRKVDEKKLTWRFRQTSPNKKYKYRTITLTKGIKAVVIVNKRKITKGGFELNFPNVTKLANFSIILLRGSLQTVIFLIILFPCFSKKLFIDLARFFYLCHNVK